MQALFIVVALVGLLYFLFAKRRFDFFSTAFFSACVYFMPGFFGYTNGFVVEGEFQQSLGSVPVSLLPEAYLIFTTVLAAILLGGVILDYTATDQGPETKLRGGENAAVWATVLALGGFVMSAVTTGDALLSADKNDALAELNRWYALWSVGASLGAVLSFKQRRWVLFSLSMALLLADLYIGFRYSFAITIIAIFTLWLAGGGHQRFMVRNWKVASVGGLFAVSMFVYKQLFVLVKQGSWSLVIDEATRAGLYAEAVNESEPFVTQAILNKVLASQFHVGVEHFLDSVRLIVPFSRILGGPSTGFNELFQPVLFPQVEQVEVGLANNIWAEMLSSGGWLLFALFVLSFISLLALGSYLLKARDPVVVSGAALLFSYWAFYIHRNDLIFQISVEKQVLFLWAVCLSFSMVSYELASYLKGTGAAKGRPSDKSAEF